MKNKRELAKFLAKKIDEEYYDEDEGCYNLILESLVEFEELKEDKALSKKK